MCTMIGLSGLSGTVLKFIQVLRPLVSSSKFVKYGHFIFFLSQQVQLLFSSEKVLLKTEPFICDPGSWTAFSVVGSVNHAGDLPPPRDNLERPLPEEDVASIPTPGRL